MSSVSYMIYPSLLDKFGGYIDSDAVYDKYWGFSENPPFTPEEFHEKLYIELLASINREEHEESEAAAKGTAFNLLIDRLIGAPKTDKDEDISFREVIDSKGRESYMVDYKDFRFAYPKILTEEFVIYYANGLAQQKVEGVLDTKYGNVLLYGYIDYLMPTSVHDLKTTGNYSAFKFKHNNQHLVYPFCLNYSGNDVRLFEYNVTDFKDIYTEFYAYEPDRDIPILRERVEEFIRFLNDNRDKITDNKIFGRL